MTNSIAGTLRVPNQNAPRAFVATGGAVGGSVVSTIRTRVVVGGHMTYPTIGGALSSAAPVIVRGGATLTGVADKVPYSPARKSIAGAGGALGGGDAAEQMVSPSISAALTTVSASLAPPSPYNYINGRFPAAISATGSAQAGDTGIDAALTLMATTFTVIAPPAAGIVAKLTKISSSFTGGQNAQSIIAKFPLMGSVVAGDVGEVGVIDSALYAAEADLTALAGSVASIDAALPTVDVSLSALAGGIGSITASLPRSGAALVSFMGTAGTISAVVGVISARVDGGFGATGSISAELPRPEASITVLVNAAAQQLVMVVNTSTSAVSTYEDFDFNGFFELGGKYYATGAAGLVQVDVGGTDNGAEISAGLGTGLWTLGSEYQKRVSGAYMTARLGGDMTVTATTDEAATYAPSSVTLSQLGVAQLVQRRVPLARGLAGKSWQFEFNNVAGADFDFGGFGVNLDVSARRIQGAHNG